MPVKDTQGALSQTGSGAFDGLPSSGFDVEVVMDTEPNGGTARNYGKVSTDRTDEPK